MRGDAILGGMSAEGKTFLGIPRADAVWLPYLAFLLFQPIFDPNTGVGAWAFIALATALFIPVYGFTHRVIGSRPYLWRRGGGALGTPGSLLGIGLLAAMGVAFSYGNSGATVFLIYAAAAAGKVRPRKRAHRTLGAVLGLLVAAFLISPVPLPYRLAAFTPVAVFAPIIGLMTIHQDERREAAAKLRMAQEQVEHLATIAERERIARDLHDLLGHSLSTITLKSALAARLAGEDPERAEREMLDVERLSRETLNEVRAAVRGYRRSGFEAELASAKLALEAAGAELDYYTERIALRPEVEAVLAVTLREAVTNVIRHAAAERCQVTLVDDGSFVVLSVTDDRAGERTDSSVSGGSAAVEGTGLASMRERLRALGGTVELAPSGLGGSVGSRLQVSVPRQAAILTEPVFEPAGGRLAHS